jgi:dienelactone hydrolase
MKKLLALILVSLGLAVTCSQAGEKASGSMAYFRSGDVTLRGYLYRPEGSGPFPAVVFVRANNKPISESAPPAPELGEYYTSKGFVLFIPMHRTVEELKAEAKGGAAKVKPGKRVNLPEYTAMTKDVAAAVTWLKSQSYVNENRVAVIGHGAGAVASLLLSQQEVEVSGYVLFSPATQTWDSKPDVAKAMVEAVREAKAPIFVLQPQNDYSLEPSQALARELSAKGRPNTARIYDPHGTTHQQAFAFATNGTKVWGKDVMNFLDAVFHL